MEQNEHKEQYWAGKQEKEEKQSEEPIERQGEMRDDHQQEQEQFKEPIEKQGEVLDEREEMEQDEEPEQGGKQKEEKFDQWPPDGSTRGPFLRTGGEPWKLWGDTIITQPPHSGAG